MQMLRPIYSGLCISANSLKPAADPIYHPAHLMHTSYDLGSNSTNHIAEMQARGRDAILSVRFIFLIPNYLLVAHKYRCAPRVSTRGAHQYLCAISIMRTRGAQKCAPPVALTSGVTVVAHTCSPWVGKNGAPRVGFFLPVLRSIESCPF